jgi:vacuolar-type H+-ATPase subunit F/Vma7
MEGKVAVLGEEDFALPFSALGLDTFTTSEEADEIREKAGRILEGSYTLVVLAENIAKVAEQVFEPVREKAVPVLVVVPFTAEPTGIAVQALGETLRRATGINILETA